MDGFNTTLNQGGNGGGGGGAAAKLAVSITYAALKALRDGGNLVPGTWYRITDYACTTTQENTQSANHAFDIIVRADDASHLNENGYAAHHAGDTYFATCKLEAWELKYSLDNDTTRFGWADGTNGTGVVYWMKDEWDNEAPYDFKNIKFSRTLTDGAYDDHGTAAYVYTFNSYSSGTNSDASVLAATNNKIRCCNNVISEYRNTSSGDYKLLLNNIVFLNVYANNTGYTCSGNTLGFGSFDITIGSNVLDVEIGSNSYSIEIGSNSSRLTIGSYVQSVTIGSSCYNINTGSSCGELTIGSNCFQLNIGSSCNTVTIGSNSGNITIGSSVNNSEIGSNSRYITIGSSCDTVTIGSYCSNFTLYNGVVGVAVTTGTQASPVKNCMVLSGEYGGKTATEIAFTANLNRTQVATLDANGDVVVYIPGAAS